MGRKKDRPSSATSKTSFRNRIKELRQVRAGDLIPNPNNWRTRPKSQREALLGVLGEIGDADAIIANEMPDGRLRIIDGHLRADLDPDRIVSVLVTDLTEAEADKLLVVLDPLAGMSEADPEKLGALLETIETESEAVSRLLYELADIAEPATGKGGSEIGLTGTKDVAVTAVLVFDEIEVFERALALTGKAARGEAMAEVCKEYLRAKGQYDVPAQGVAAAEGAR